MFAGHTGHTKPVDQFRRAGQRVGQDLDHGLLDLPGGEPPALRAIRSGISDQRSGDVIAIASALLDGVGIVDKSAVAWPGKMLNKPLRSRSRPTRPRRWRA